MEKKYISVLLRRMLSSLLVLFLMVSLIFFLIRLAPGNPVLRYISPKLSPELMTKVQESFKLNESIMTQYAAFIENLVKGDLGISYQYRSSVTDVIKEFLPFTIIFAFICFLIQIIISLFLALFSAGRINKVPDRILNKLSLILYAVPTFVIGVILIFFISGSLSLFPTSGLRSYNHEELTFPQKIWDYIRHLVLPVITLSAGGIAVFYKYLRDNLITVFNSTFVLNLRSYGIEDKTIIRKHIIPNAVSPLISIAGIELGTLLGGALITEVIFGLPGMGRLAVDAIMARDYPLIIGCSITAGFLVILSNFTADIVKAKLDKRLLLKGVMN